MKFALICAVICIFVVVPAAAISCMTKPEWCNENECCVEFGMFGYCRSLMKEEEECELKPLTKSGAKHVHLMKCPCAPELECQKDDTIKSDLTGKCKRKAAKR